MFLASKTLITLITLKLKSSYLCFEYQNREGKFSPLQVVTFHQYTAVNNDPENTTPSPNK